MERKDKRVVAHLEDDLGYETDDRTFEKGPEDEGLLYDNLD